MAEAGAMRLRTMRVAPKVSESMSSEAIAYARPCLTSSAHWASASDGASTTGTPMSVSRRLHSALCTAVTLTVRLANFSTASASPASLAASRPAPASVRLSERRESSSRFIAGGLPSNTNTGFMPASSMRTVR